MLNLDFAVMIKTTEIVLTESVFKDESTESSLNQEYRVLRLGGRSFES